MSVDMQPLKVESSAVPRRERDDVYWTELEFRRLGNVVAEMIQSRRYVGEDEEANRERELLRKRVDAMRRKALRILVRAEGFTESDRAFWPGLDSSLTEPVSLAEEYVRIVTNYQTELDEEENRVNMLRRQGLLEPFCDAENNGARERNMDDSDAALNLDGTKGDSEDDVSYGNGIARPSADRDASSVHGLAEDSGVRRRKGGGMRSGEGRYTKEDEDLMARHQPVQDQLTEDLAKLVSQLKGSVTEINSKIVKDGKIIDEAEEAIDRNISGISSQRSKLSAFTKSTSTSWWTIWVLLAVAVFVFFGFVVLTRIPV